MRTKKIENEMTNYKKEAIEKKKKGDSKGALLSLKKMKMREKEVAKLEGQSIMIEQQKSMIESSALDAETFKAMKAGSAAVEAAKKDLDIDDTHELLD